MRKTRHRTWLVRDLVHLLVIGIAIGAAAYASVVPSGTPTSAQADVAGLGGLFTQSNAPLDVSVTQESTGTFQQTAGIPSFSILSTSEAASDPTSQQEQAALEDRLQALAVPSVASGVTSEAPAAATPASEPDDPNCTKDKSHPLYCIYTVKSGDTLSGIATAYGLKSSRMVSAAEMLAQSNKPDVVDSDDIRPGQKLRVPVASGIIHTAFAAESLAEVAGQYGVKVADIQAVGANNVGASLSSGQEVLVPSPASLPAQSAPATPTPTPSPSPTPESTKAPTATPEPSPEPTAAAELEAPAAALSAETALPPPIIESTATATPLPATPTPTTTKATATPSAAAKTAASPTSTGSKTAFIWPVAGPISSYMGPSHPLGIDIDLFDHDGVAIGAAAAGTVTFAGGNACCSYGYYVIVDHGSGITTLYAHFQGIAVKEGQKVSQSQTLGYGGHTGYATGTHLHFEMRLNGNVVNPLTYLP